jgi:hypothetical protein
MLSAVSFLCNPGHGTGIANVPSVATGRAHTGLVVCPVPDRPSGTDASLETPRGHEPRITIVWTLECADVVLLPT